MSVLLTDMRSFVRDLNLNLITSNQKIEIDITKRYNDKIRWFMPNRNLIAYIIECGGVLTGSRALRCYMVNGNQILDRRTKDWDFIITQDMAFKICERFDIDMIPNIDKVISIKKQRRYVHPAYSESFRIGPVDVQMIIKEELPEYTEINGIRISSLPYVLNEKVKIIDELYQSSQSTNSISEERKELGKHLDDMTRLIIRFNSSKLK
jgi:hypothetical protein